ncbi:MAG TPA: universal stress protein [Candidatus Binatia bacterium]|nr:universal stress protein [Candidatus Binatia bacterium]
MYAKILVPLDGSKTAENVVPLARSFARGLQIPVELLGVVDVAEMARRGPPSQALMISSIVDDTTRRFDDYLERVAKDFPVGNVQCTVRKGNAAEAIIELAAAEKQTLIAMATHGRSGLNRWLLGSVVEKVLRGASNPTLVVRAKKEKNPVWEIATLKRAIVPLDGSELSERILPHVEALAKRLDLEVTLLGVYGGRLSGGGGEGFYSLDAFIPNLHSETVTYLAAKTEEMRQRGINKVSFAAKQGLEADEIIATARETLDTLIAMCTHGRTGVGRWMLGSVTETVVRHSDDPVLVVRPT